MEQNNINRVNQSTGVRGGAIPAARPSSPLSTAPNSVGDGAKPKATKEKSAVKKIILVAIVAVAIVGAFFAYQLLFPGARIDGGKYQAVFLTNGQVYFGKLKDTNNDYMYLNDVYYIQAKSAGTSAGNPQDTGTQAGVELVKLGNEVHGPVDEMTIRKEQVLFFENLKTDGQVAKTIAEDKKK